MVTADIHEQTRTEAVLRARRLLEKKPVYLDTETTGIEQIAEIVEVAVINDDGDELLHTLVKPGGPIPFNATRVHGITEADVLHAPRFDVVWYSQLKEIITGTRLAYDQPICIYNAAFDMRLMKQSLVVYGLTPYGFKPGFCVMNLYAEFYGEWNDFYQSYRWQSLTDAAAQCGLEWKANSHRALADARMCREILRHIAAQEVERG